MPEETEAKRSKGKPSTTPQPGKFILRSAVLLALTLLFYWIGWRSPWARAHQTVRVELADPPKAAPAPAPMVQTPASDEPQNRPAADEDNTLQNDDQPSPREESVSANASRDEAPTERRARRSRSRRHERTP